MSLQDFHDVLLLLANSLPEKTTDELQRQLKSLEQQHSQLVQAVGCEDVSYDSSDLADIETNPLARISALERLVDVFKMELARRGNQSDSEVPARPDSSLLTRTPDILKRMGIIAQNPEMSSQELCGRFDLESIPLPSRWSTQRDSVTNWRDAYKDAALRKRIQTMICKERRKLKQHS